MRPHERAFHPSRAQVETLLDFLERNPSLAKGYSRVPSARDATRQLWERIAIRLNSMGGSHKSSTQWNKYWSDKKSFVKKKAAARYAARVQTGGGLGQVVELSEVEERILTLMGGEGFAVGDRHLSINPFEPSQSFQSQNHHNLDQPPPHNDTTCSLPSPSCSYPQNMLAAAGSHVDVDATSLLYSEIDLEVHPGTQCSRLSYSIQQCENTGQRMPTASLLPAAGSPASPSILSAQPRRPPPPAPTPAPAPRAPPPPALTPPPAPPSRPPPPSPTNRARSPPTRNNTPRRRRRRLLTAAASPPSQRRSQFVGLSEKFIKLEEERLRMERRNTAVLEKLAEHMVERDAAVALGLSTIGEGLRVLGEAVMMAVQRPQ